MKNEKFKKITIGINQSRSDKVTGEEVFKQIKELRQYPINLEADNKPVTWNELLDGARPRTMLANIIKDRVLRVDLKSLMADRPPFAVATVSEKGIERIEYYEGHDKQELIYDLRSKEWQNKNLPNYQFKDPKAYNPDTEIPKNTPAQLKQQIKTVRTESHRILRDYYELDDPNSYNNIRFPSLKKAYGVSMAKHKEDYTITSLGVFDIIENTSNLKH